MKTEIRAEADPNARLRWTLIVPTAWAAWCLVLAIGFGLSNLADALCPADQVVSGMCTAAWHERFMKANFCSCAALAAALILISCTLMAPHHRRVVSIIVFSAGTAFALWMTIAGGTYLEFASAAVASLLALCWLWRREPG